MKTLQANYKALVASFGITLLLVLFFQGIGFIRINPSAIGENIFFFVLWWGILSLPIHKFDVLKKNRWTIYKIVALIGLLFVILIVDVYMDIPDNPVTVFLFVSFWVGLAYLLSPDFVKKYSWLIIGVYILGISYFTYVRLFTGTLGDNLASRDEAIFGLIIPVPFFVSLWVYEQWRWLSTLASEKSKAELALLKSQINPHFFFNTLNNLYGLTVEHSEKAPNVILELSELMRYVIYEGQKERVAIEDEISYIENYIALHKIRYHKKVRIDFETEVYQSCKIAPLLFIILLENAFKHGVETLTEEAYVDIQLISEKDQVIFSIENNVLPNNDLNEEGIGLKNLKKRLELIYPHQYELSTEIESTTYRARLQINTIND